MAVNFKFRPITGKDLSCAYSLFRYLSFETNSLFHLNSKITGYFKKRDVECARNLFDEMPHKNVVTWNCMISGYIKNGMIGEARKVFDSMPIKNIVSSTAMLSGYAKNGMLEEARALFDSINEKNVVCWNSMISGYVYCGRTQEARAIFDAMPVKNDVSWTSMIEGYFKYGAVSEAESLFSEASSKSLLICNAMLTGYGEALHTDKSYDLFTRMCERDVVSWTCMIASFMRVGEVKRARELFDEMPEKDMVAWTVMIQGYLDHKKIELARELFDRMPFKDIVAWNSMLGGFTHNGKLEDAYDFFMRMPERNVVSWNMMLRASLQQDNMTNARNFFEGMPRKDETSWNTLISGYQSEEALHLFVQMLSKGLKPDQGTLTSMTSVSGILVRPGWGRAIHVFAVKTGYENDSTVTSSLISMYSRCGFINDASQVFRTIKKCDTVAWNAMLVAYAHHYSAKEVLNLFSCMSHAGCRPDLVTFLVLLTACAHSGLVSESWKYLKLMESWKLIPKPEHYASIVDLLGRSGLITEAFKLVNQFSVELPAYAWESLLSACRIHENYELSDLIAEKILGYESSDVSICVLQSNIYSARGMWKDAADIRAKMKQSQIKKEVGCSWIDLNSSVSCFTYNDKSHTQTTDIYKELESLAVLIEDAGAKIHYGFVPMQRLSIKACFAARSGVSQCRSPFNSVTARFELGSSHICFSGRNRRMSWESCKVC